MSLRDKYKLAIDRIENGFWVELSHEDEKNSDGTSPKFKLKEISFDTKKSLIKAMRVAKKSESKKGKEENYEVTIKESIDDFCDNYMLDWENFEPVEDGKKVKFSNKEAKKVLQHDDWFDLYKLLDGEVAKQSKSFEEQVDEKEAKAKN